MITKTRTGASAIKYLANLKEKVMAKKATKKKAVKKSSKKVAKKK